jgi:hypothetical protein
LRSSIWIILLPVVVLGEVICALSERVVRIVGGTRPGSGEGGGGALAGVSIRLFGTKLFNITGDDICSVYPPVPIST